MQQMQNSVTLIGNLGSDIQVTTVKSGKKVARTSIATNEFYRDKDGNSVKSTQWHRLVAWGPKAESMEKYLAKGSHLIIHGRLVHRTYEDKDGSTRYVSEVIVNSFEALQKQAA